MIKGKRGQLLDIEALEEPGFWILIGMSVGATVIGFIMGKKMGWIPLPIWQLLIIIAIEVVVCLAFASRG